MADGLDIGSLFGKIILEDGFSGVLELIGGKVDSIDKKLGGFGGRVAEYATGFFTAELALKAVSAAAEFVGDALVKLTVEGSEIATISENFDHLNTQAGRVGATLLGDLREGLHNTVDDLTLMKLVNNDLAAGMNLTDQQFRTLADGAFALSQVTGKDVTESLETMNQAMLTGQTRSVQLLTGKIDLTKAEETYAKTLGTTAERLTADEKLEAARLAILEKVAQATARVGEQTDGLGEMYQQATTFVENMTNELAKQVATSPVVLTAFNEIRDAVVEAFGGDQQKLIETVTSLIEEGAIKAIEFGQIVADAVGIAGMTWNSFLIILESVAQGWRAIQYVVGTVVVGLMELAEFLSGGALDFSSSIENGQQHLDELYQTMAEGENRIAGYKKAQDEWAVSTGHVRDKLEEIKQKMIAAKDQAKENTEATTGMANAQEDAALTSHLLGEAVENTTGAVRRSQTEAKAYAEAWEAINAAVNSGAKNLTQVLAQMDPQVVKTAKSYLDLGISIEKVKVALGLTDSEAKALHQTWKEGQELLDEQKQKLKDSAEAWAELREVAKGYDNVLATVGARTVAEIQDFMRMGVSLDQLQKAYMLTDAQIAAVAEELELSDKAWQKEKENLAEVGNLVRTLSGEYITLEEAQKRRQAGGSFDVTRANLAESAKWWRIPEAFAFEWAKKGASFAEIIEIWNRGNPIQDWVVHGPRIPGFREGGYGDFGDGTLVELHGKELITPIDKVGSMLGNVTNYIYVNGTAAEVATKVSDEIMRRLKRHRQFGAA